MPEPKRDHDVSSPGPEAILKAVVERHALSREDARRAPRLHYCVPVTIELPATHTGGARRLRCATNNISAGGFAFIADCLIQPGTIISVQFESLPGTPRAAGIVRSSNYLCGTQHRVGVEFTQ